MLVSGLVSPRTTRLPTGTVPSRTTRRPDAGLRIVVRGLEVVDVLRQFLRIVAPEAGLVDLVQIGVEDRHRLKREDFVHQFRQLRPRLDMEIHLQRAARELVEVVHLAAPGLRLPACSVTRAESRLTTSAVSTKASRVTELAGSAAELNEG